MSTIYHAEAGAQKAGHKYVSRVMKNGRWIYQYAKNQAAKSYKYLTRVFKNGKWLYTYKKPTQQANTQKPQQDPKQQAIQKDLKNGDKRIKIENAKKQVSVSSIDTNKTVYADKGKAAVAKVTTAKATTARPASSKASGSTGKSSGKKSSTKSKSANEKAADAAHVQAEEKAESKNSEKASSTTSKSKSSTKTEKTTEKKEDTSKLQSKYAEYTDGDTDFDDDKFLEENRVGDTDFFINKKSDGSVLIVEEDMKWTCPAGTNIDKLKEKLSSVKGDPKEFVKNATEAIDEAVKDSAADIKQLKYTKTSMTKSRYFEYNEDDTDFDDKNYSDDNRVANTNFFIKERPDGSMAVLEEDMKWNVPSGIDKEQLGTAIDNVNQWIKSLQGSGYQLTEKDYTDMVSNYLDEEIQRQLAEKKKKKKASDEEFQHHGTLGMKWGRRRYQNPDGTLTAEGRVRYNRPKLNATNTALYKNEKRHNRDVAAKVVSTGVGTATTLATMSAGPVSGVMAGTLAAVSGITLSAGINAVKNSSFKHKLLVQQEEEAERGRQIVEAITKGNKSSTVTSS